MAALEAMRGAITQVALVGDAPHLHVLLPADASVATVAAAQVRCRRDVGKKGKM